MKNFYSLLGWLALTFSAALTGFFIQPDGYYAALAKPTWAPPAWVFGPAWTMLYAMMAVAAWRVWRQGGWRVQHGPLTLYVIQLALNALWTPLFFGLRWPGGALVEIVLLWLSIAVTGRAFFRVDRIAGGLFLPYLLWVGFAAALNFSIWLRNS